ncbi:MFS transporter [Subdoligranulum variabile]|uniref:Transporter, major facilitator family protein n=1 Tax=Subdoligranulum variabile DSM 15176 TaxID=411471 RepID=D1PIW0_9FIRM|nr:MFS transporter [Subdoligranulum variabile]EFB77469.1 transporter, major facilitator family protein [Subdoligranulum variabile DSM 15176]UWP67353.1 MFS transporter [Subdoligranulum variabile]
MVSLLLPVIYLAFISLGLPDGLLGAAWPSMYGQMGADLSWAGAVSMIISAGTIVSSLASDRLNSRLGTGKVTACSVALTAVALFGFSLSTAFWQLCLWAVPYGLGAGSVDAALNNYVALHYESRHMSWLHCMWGIGASIGPVIMGWALAADTWQSGYRIISLLQIVLTAVLVFSLPLWKRPDRTGAADITPEHRSLPQLMRIPGVPEVMVSFACYSAVECTTGMWAASYCTLVRGIDAGTAAGWASLFYLGITVGRFFCGFLTMKFNDHQMILGGQAVILAGLLLIFLPAGNGLLFAGLIIVGLGCAPIYPSIIHETPANFGRNLSMSMTGVQMAAAYVGTTLLPPFFGLLAQHISMTLFPWYLLAALILMTVSSEAMHRKTAAHRAANAAS